MQAKFYRLCATMVAATGTILSFGIFYQKTAVRLQAYLRCRDAIRLPHYAEVGLASETALLPRATSAIVYCDVILSGESVRRSLKKMLREGSQPIAVLCVVDGRTEPGETIRVLGRTYPVFSLVSNQPLLSPLAPSAAGATPKPSGVLAGASTDAAR